jgi:hypothetical protein
MKYKFTRKGKKMFPEMTLRTSEMGTWTVKAVTNGGGYVLVLGTGPVEIKALIDMGIMEEDIDWDYGSGSSTKNTAEPPFIIDKNQGI